MVRGQVKAASKASLPTGQNNQDFLTVISSVSQPPQFQKPDFGKK
jgi:hypothetical protein